MDNVTFAMVDPSGYIRVFVGGTYGNLEIHPANTDAMRLLSITGRRTFKASDLARARELGLTVKVDGLHRDQALVEHAIASDCGLYSKAASEPSLDPVVPIRGAEVAG